ncbi:MAG: FlgD immunoglobulin-like domain containing protein [Candidatus Eiseniibacteriota bacterium]
MLLRVSALRSIALVSLLLTPATPFRASASLPVAAAPDAAAPAAQRPGPQLRHLGNRVERTVPKVTPTEIRLANGIVFDTRTGEPQVPARLRAATTVAPEDRLSLVVQVESPIESGWAALLEAAGARVESFLPNSAFLVRVDARDRAKIDALSFVEWTGAYHPAYRISGQTDMTLRSGRAEYTVLLFDDGDARAVSDHVSFLGGRIEDASDNGINKILRLELDRSRMEELASHPDVQWIEPRAHFEISNSSAQWVDQTNVLNDRKVWTNGITGVGQVVMVGDSGIRTTHQQFVDALVPITTYGDYPTHRKIIAYQRGAQHNNVAFADLLSGHGSHTDGTIAGNDDGIGASANDGLAKGAKIYFLDCGGTPSSTIYTPGDLNEYYAAGYIGNAGGAARVSSNSWGDGTAAGAYTTNSMTTDQFAWEHKDFLICFSNGNAGSAGSVGAPATAKNILSSGGTLNGTSATSIYSSTSRGPTDDGRYKPTVCSPASSLTSASGSSDTGYAGLSGTSMSCPNLAGSATLVRDYFMRGYYPTGAAVAANEFTPSAALLRAMMVNSGVDDFVSFTFPDHNIGWGRILLDNVLFFPGDTRRTVVLDEPDGVVTGEVREYEIYVDGAAQDLKVTLVWTDAPSTPTAGANLVNDLDLVVKEGATTYLGNVWSSGQSQTGGSADGINVEENVRRTTPVVGNYTIEVHGANVPMGAQPYALVVSGSLGGAAGVLTLDAGAYEPLGTLDIRVEDTDAGGSVTVSVSSGTESSPESFVMAGANGVYTGSFPLTLDAASNGDAQLSVSHGDQVTVTYSDASPAHVATTTAVVDTHEPVITNVAADPAGVTAVVTWDTDVHANSRIEYGTTTALGSLSTLDEAHVTQHSHELQGLVEETTYNFDVLSEDPAGNLVRDDFGGQHYRFTTGRRADVLFVNADPNTTEEEEKYYDAFDATGWTYNLWEKPQADTPEVGDLTSGMRSYKAVWWQVGWEQYPQFLGPARDSLTAYHDGGGRLVIVSQDLAWAFSDNTSGFWSPVKKTWYETITHSLWQADPTPWTSLVGIGADPISGSYTGGIPYTAHRSGADGDEVDLINGTGTASYVWRNNDVSADDVAVKWVNGVPNGTAGTGVWGGTPTRVVSMFFEWIGVNKAVSNDPVRADILNKTLIWLIGGDHPDAVVTTPNGGEVFTTSPVSVSWTQSTDTANGRDPASTRLEYSDDGGMSWTLVTAAPGSSPYSWDVSALSSGTAYRVRAVVVDDGTPELSGTDASNSNFTLAIPGNENRGPVVIAGSPVVSPDPPVKPNPATLTATITDALTGGSDIAAAEWSSGGSPAPAGTGSPMTGTFNAVEVAVSAALSTTSLPSGATFIWVRGQDAAGNWGGAAQLAVQVNGGAVDAVLVDLPPDRFALAQSFPNPFADAARIAFALPKASPVDLAVYDVSGRLVRTLLEGPMAAGRHVADWDGRDAEGRKVSSGVYFYRIVAGADRAERKMVRLR